MRLSRGRIAKMKCGMVNERGGKLSEGPGEAFAQKIRGVLNVRRQMLRPYRGSVCEMTEMAK
jgi:hypothetical protein